MGHVRLEELALEAIDRVLKGTGTEDSRIEFKSEWPTDHAKAARQLAGQCNASSGDDVIWIVGVDEAGKVVGCKPEDRADWWTKVQSHFNEKAPTLLTDVTVAGQPAPVVALAFTSTDAPFVVMNPVRNTPSAGPVESEVPWREGSRTRSARRQDLLRLLGRRIRTPVIDLVKYSLSPQNMGTNPIPETYRRFWWLVAEVAVIPAPDTVLRYLVHRSTVELEYAAALPAPPAEVSLRVFLQTPGDGQSHRGGARRDGSLVEIDRAATLEIHVALVFSEDVPQVICEGGRIKLYPASDEPELLVSLPPIRSQFYSQ